MLYNLIMTIVLTTGEYEVTLLGNNLNKQTCDQRASVLAKIVKEELEADASSQIDFVRVSCTQMKQQTNTMKYTML